MDVEGLAQAFLYSWGLCFVSSELRSDPEVLAELRGMVTNHGSSLRRGIQLNDTDIFARTFAFFDVRVYADKLTCGSAQ